MKPIETASDLYREIKRRGLHLRERNGRDNALLQELTSKLKCPEGQLQRFLDGSNLSAEAFLTTFLRLAAPFARMFQEIWDYLSQNTAPKARETISVRFGFQNSDDQCAVNLDQFRRYVETSKRVLASVLVQLWPDEALHGLFDVGKELHAAGGEPAWTLYQEHGRYDPGKPYALPMLSSTRHRFDEIVQNVRDAFQQVIDDYAIETDEGHSGRRLAELDQQEKHSERAVSLRRSAYLLTDLLPTWYYILERCPDIDDRLKDAAFQKYEATIKPHLRTEEGFGETSLLEAVDILDLPFWRHRWHTYEVWGSVLTLRCLQDFRPALNIERGYVPLDGYAGTVVANLKAHRYTSACVAAQVETPFSQGKRKAIKPDLRICFADPFCSDNTACVVEFKQRWQIDAKSLTEMATAYSEGCPRSAGVLILNYDNVGTPVGLVPQCYFVEGVQPLNRSGVGLFEERLSEVLGASGLEPIREKTLVLLDVSSSMGGAYGDESVQSYLRRLLGMGWVKVLRFNNGLVEGGDLTPHLALSLRTSGGTELGQALRDVESLFGSPRKVLIVTDGEHDHPTEMLGRIPEVRECLPGEIGDNLAWLG